MAQWSDWGSPLGKSISQYDFLILAWKALDEKAKALGGRYPGKVGKIWSEGTVTAIEAFGNGDFKISMATTDTWGVPGPPCYNPGQRRWVNYVPNSGGNSGCLCPPTYIPSSYDCVIDGDEFDNRKLVRGTIYDEAVSGTNGTVWIRGQEIRDAITAGFLSGPDELVGKHYQFTRSSRRETRLDRWPEKPNDPELWKDSAPASLAFWPPDGSPVESGTQLSAFKVEPMPGWTLDQWAGKELMAFGGEGLRRLPILHNSDDTIFVAKQDGLTGGTFAIIQPGAKHNPARPAWRWTQWYTGNAIRQAGHFPDDYIAGADAPSYSERWSEGNPCSENGECKDYPHSIFDNDWQFPFDFEALCTPNRAGTLVHPNLHKSFRRLQIEMRQIAPAFVKRGWTAGNGWPNGKTDATYFADVGINNGTSTVQWQPPTGSGETYKAGFYYFIASTAFPAVYFTTRTIQGVNDVSGFGAVGADGRVVIREGYGYPPPENETPTPKNSPVGRAVIYSAGETRYRPRAFLYHRDITIFIPDLKPKLQGGGVYDPPQVSKDDKGHYDCESGKGTWITRPASSGGLVVDDNGIVHDSAEPFVTGEFYRAWGDDYSYFPGGDLQADNAPLITYEDAAYRGRLKKQNQTARDTSRTGTITSGNRYSFSDSEKNWFNDHKNSGVMRTESGTATAGTTTTLTDGSKDTTDPELPWSCWYDPIRYPLTGVYVDWILEVDQSVDGQTVTTKLPITGFADRGAGGVQFTFAAVDGYTVHAGDTWRIREPHTTLNKWRGCKVKVTKGDGSSVELDCRQSDDHTIYVEPQPFEFEEGWAYEIIERGYGGVWKWTGSQMIPATGDDHVRVGVTVPAPFHEEMTENRESFVKDFGIVRYGDIMDASQFFTQIFTLMNSLKDWRRGFAWVPRDDKDTEEFNYALWPSFNDYGTYEEFATQTDKDIAHATYYDPDWVEETIYTEDTWHEEYMGVREGLLRQVFESGGFFPWMQEVGQAPQRTFAMGGTAEAIRGLDQSHQYRNAPYFIAHGLGMSIDSATASYAYGRAEQVPTLLPASVDMYVYSTIDADDHDQGHTLTVTEDTNPYRPTKWWQDVTYTFDSGSVSGAVYREWSSYCTVSVDSNGVAMGPKFGETSGFESMIGHESSGCPGYYPDCHMESDFTTDFAAVENMNQHLQQIDRTNGSQYFWGKTQKSGYVVKEQVAIVRPTMQYIV